MLDAQVHAREVRKRLWQPENGRGSTEAEIVSDPEVRRRRRETEAEREAETNARAVYASAAALHAAITTAATAAHERALEELKTQGFSPPRPTVNHIMAEVCRRYGVKEIDIRSKRRTAAIVRPRQLVAYLCKELTELSYPHIGRRIGGRDHTTILCSVKKIAALIVHDLHLAAEIDDIKRSLGVAYD